MPEDIRARILIADDREENRYILAHALAAAGFDCTEASTGIEALELSQGLPDLIILDVRLPDISGYEVCQRIKRDPQTCSVPILQVSASFTSSGDRARALNSGADGYLTHPVDRVVLIATVRSLLRLRTAEMATRKSSDQWQATFDALAEGLALVDANNRLLRSNRAFSEVCGSRFGSDALVDIADLFGRLVGTGDTFHLDECRRKTAEFVVGQRTVQLSVSQIEGDAANGEKIVVLEDITDRKLAEYAIRTAEKLAATGKLANAIAHEINNPLEALTNLIYLAGKATSIDEAHGLLSRADTELARIARITRQSLSFHRDTETPIEVDVGELIEDVIKLFERMAESHQVRLVCDRHQAATIWGFPGQLSQVFGNLIRNAAEAAFPQTDIVVRVRIIHRHDQEGVRITIHDRGCGIPQDIQRKVFDPFFTTKDLKGSGLGLWVSRSLILKHGGTIRFRSSERPGHCGTVFEVFLPTCGRDRNESRPPGL
jgi:two-component system, NtrC family, sensor kinase